MDLTSPLTRTAAGLARRTIVPPLALIDQRVVVPVLGTRSPVHQVLAALVGATAAATSTPSPAPAATTPRPRPERSRPEQAQDRHDPDTGGGDDSAARGELTRDERERIERLADQLLEQEGEEHFVGELADEELRRAQATIRAKQVIEEEDHRLGDGDADGGA